MTKASKRTVVVFLQTPVVLVVIINVAAAVLNVLVMAVMVVNIVLHVLIIADVAVVLAASVLFLQ